jgi:hypothetical protein
VSSADDDGLLPAGLIVEEARPASVKARSAMRKLRAVQRLSGAQGLAALGNAQHGTGAEPEVLPEPERRTRGRAPRGFDARKRRNSLEHDEDGLKAMQAATNAAAMAAQAALAQQALQKEPAQQDQEEEPQTMRQDTEASPASKQQATLTLTRSPPRWRHEDSTMLALLAEHTDAAAAQPQHEEQQRQHHRLAQWHDGHHRTEINPASSQPGASSTAAQPQPQPQPQPEPDPEPKLEQHEEQQRQHHRHAQWHDGHHRTEINSASSQPGASSTAAQPQLQPQPEPEPEPEPEADAMSDAMSDFSGDDEFLSADEDEYHRG